VEVNGELKSIPNWGKIELKKDRYLNIKNTKPGCKNLRIDVRGFSLPAGKKDDSNVKIYPRDLIRKYSFREKGEVYFVKIYNGASLTGGFQLQCPPPKGSK
jgi:hypothetical protein